MLRICISSFVFGVICCSLQAQPPLPGKPPFIFPSQKKDESEKDDSLPPASVLRAFLDQTGEKPPSPDEIVSAIKQQLESDDVKQRLEALFAIENQTSADVTLSPKLNAMLAGSEDPFERVLAASAALKTGTSDQQSALQSLSEGLRSEDPAVAVQAAIGLGKGGKESEDALREALGDSRPSARALAAEVLGRIGSSSTGNELADLLRDEDPTVRRAAAKSLGTAGNQTSKDALIEAFKNDSELSVRAHSAASLVELGCSEPDQAELVDAMVGSDQRMSLATMRAVANCKAPIDLRAELLGRALQKAQPLYAAELIGHLVDMEAPGMNALLRALEPKSSRYWAVVALSEFGSKASPAAEKLVELLNESTPDIKTEILFTLGNIDPSRRAVAPAVATEMNSRDNGVRYAATLSAIRLGLDDETVQTRLRANRTSDDKVLALVSAFALAKLNPDQPRLGFDAMKALKDAIDSGDPRLKPLAEQALLDLKKNLPRL
ncbi:MAG: HEAT repeat domain-containing protein [Planctomycetota bacterium]